MLLNPPQVNSMTTTPTLADPGRRSTTPWHREPWPWILMAGPFSVIVASFVSAWFAISTSDGLVTEDYYKQGIAAGETLTRSRHAEELGVEASLRLTADSISIHLTGRQVDMPMPTALNVMLSHPTRAGLDQNTLLKRAGDKYVGDFHLPASGHWLVLIEDEAKTWRLMGSLLLPAAKEMVIGGGETAAKPQS
jgi:hypothetical protein